uniref:Kinesin motor domain-containing protein n=1 Tax=Timema tahoe TaxID=61484 RepID=A0A7R9IG53_9NEOP|nr:unnamed protein product [Timema tahoe]
MPNSAPGSREVLIISINCDSCGLHDLSYEYSREDLATFIAVRSIHPWENWGIGLKMVYNKKDLEKAVSPANRNRKTAKRCSGSLQQNGDDQAQGATSNMKVIVRVRPPNSKELGNNFREIIQVVDNSMLIFDPKSDEKSFFYQGVKQNRRDIAKKQNKELNFLFDCVFGYESTNSDIYESSTKEIIASVLEGYNCSGLCTCLNGVVSLRTSFVLSQTAENEGD